ncbi:hypothetical protein PAXRUDRAFT_451535 [Paxillus rubicundulus Ve08.2h10]|uniref:Uncharacterized protein n=1 Tax=Paxillus rubicundulus Ve08.2h10 TaxID=930991 RepID=A0A0D0BY02_9AGAM|nr:hypothetical protein PAXRUDRAFT_451535 [Paxillus rubicundulus Ve08.2h10]
MISVYLGILLPKCMLCKVVMYSDTRFTSPTTAEYSTKSCRSFSFGPLSVKVQPGVTVFSWNGRNSLVGYPHVILHDV